MKLTEHFSLEELIKSSTAKAKKIDNTPTQAAKTNLQRLASNILEPIRLKYGKPIIVTSGYRSMALNTVYCVWSLNQYKGKYSR